MILNIFLFISTCINDKVTFIKVYNDGSMDFWVCKLKFASTLHYSILKLERKVNNNDLKEKETNT